MSISEAGIIMADNPREVTHEVAFWRQGHLGLNAFFYIAIAFASYVNNYTFSTLISIAVIIYFLFTKPEEHFFFLVGFVPFEAVFKTFALNSCFVLLLISSLKLIFNKRPIRISVIGLISFVLLVFFEIINDYGKVSTGALLIFLSMISYLFIFVQFADRKCFNFEEIMRNTIISYFVVVMFSILQYGSFEAFISAVSDESMLVRFGEQNNPFGGAMGLPLYSALIIAMIVASVIIKHSLRIREKALLLLAGGFAFIFGVLTVSRSFLLCIGATVVFLFLSLVGSNRRKVFVILAFTAIISVAIYFVAENYINGVAEEYFFRSAHDAGTGIRGRIWESCIDFLRENPSGYLTGFGIGSYAEIGESKSLMFSAMAHNLYLDVIMSVGAAGLLCVIALLDILRKRLKKTLDTGFRIVSALPFLVYLTFGMTALSLTNLKTWIYLMAFIVMVYATPGVQIVSEEKNEQN